jgi:hypothetical protein
MNSQRVLYGYGIDDLLSALQLKTLFSSTQLLTLEEKEQDLKA